MHGSAKRCCTAFVFQVAHDASCLYSARDVSATALVKRLGSLPGFGCLTSLQPALRLIKLLVVHVEILARCGIGARFSQQVIWCGDPNGHRHGRLVLGMHLGTPMSWTVVN